MWVLCLAGLGGVQPVREGVYFSRGGLDRARLVTTCNNAMKIAAKVFKAGNSWAVRLPAALKPSSRELFIETNRNGDIILYNEQVREEAYQKRMQAWRELVATAPVDSEGESVAQESAR